MMDAASILNIEAPELYVRQNATPNAYTLAISGRKPFVVIHTSLVELLNKKELQVDRIPTFRISFCDARGSCQQLLFARCPCYCCLK